MQQTRIGRKPRRHDADASQDTDEDIITRLSRIGKSEVADAVAYHDEIVDEYNKKEHGLEKKDYSELVEKLVTLK